QQSPAACRLETRVIGADVNPYLAIAAAIASGLYGIRHQLKLQQPAINGNGYLETSYGVLPRTLEQATAAMKGAAIANELFGEKFTAHFVSTREWEWKQHLKTVTDWEMKRYFEII
ncbi:MAG TPA: glutamine synthetase, partial [Niabella sp.]